MVDAGCQAGVSFTDVHAVKALGGLHANSWVGIESQDNPLWDGKKSVPAKAVGEPRLLSY